jgi:hypothetical protein
MKNEVVPENLIIPTELAQEVMTFLAQQPYIAVAHLVQRLQNLHPAPSGPSSS